MAKILIIETDEADIALFNDICSLLKFPTSGISSKLVSDNTLSTTMCNITFYPGLFRASVSGNEPVDLLPSEYKILHLLAVYEGQTVSHEEICQIVGSPHRRKKSPPPIIAANYIMHLRKKMGFDLPETKHCIESVKGIGYRLIPSAKSSPICRP